ncbi:hypothetical protein GCM10010400_46860 [Streptomyces aculeolatus]
MPGPAGPPGPDCPDGRTFQVLAWDSDALVCRRADVSAPDDDSALPAALSMGLDPRRRQSLCSTTPGRLRAAGACSRAAPAWGERLFRKGDARRGAAGGGGTGAIQCS